MARCTTECILSGGVGPLTLPLRPGAFLALLGILAGVFYAIQGWTEGLLLVIVVLLAGILLLLATKFK